MNKKINILCVSLLITIGLFIYLTIHHYSVKLGLAGNGLCNINEKLNCDAAATSSFAEIFGIPVAIFGGTFHSLVMAFVLFIKFDWAENEIYGLTTLRFLLICAAVTSIIMGFISAFYLRVYCPFCIATYVMSFLNLALGWNLFKTEQKLLLQNYLNRYRSHLILLVSIPLLAWAVSGMMQENNGLAEIRKVVPEKIMQWKSSPQQDFNPSEGLIRKGTDSKVTLVEFADFKCPHCRTASITIDSFLKGNPQVTFIFKPWPLDGTCNKAVTSKGDGTRCTLAAWSLCAEKIGQKGWDMHHWIFKNQEELFQITDLKKYLPQIEKDLALDTAQLMACSDANDTYERIQRLSEEGTKAGLSATPTIFMNGKKLPYGQFLDVLQSAAAEIK